MVPPKCVAVKNQFDYFTQPSVVLAVGVQPVHFDDVAMAVHRCSCCAEGRAAHAICVSVILVKRLCDASVGGQQT